MSKDNEPPIGALCRSLARLGGQFQEGARLWPGVESYLFKWPDDQPPPDEKDIPERWRQQAFPGPYKMPVLPGETPKLVVLRQSPLPPAFKLEDSSVNDPSDPSNDPEVYGWIAMEIGGARLYLKNNGQLRGKQLWPGIDAKFYLRRSFGNWFNDNSAPGDPDELSQASDFLGICTDHGMALLQKSPNLKRYLNFQPSANTVRWCLAVHAVVCPAEAQLSPNRPEVKVERLADLWMSSAQAIDIWIEMLQAAPVMENENKPANHSDDFRSVAWFGTSYSFTANQAPAVRVLWENWERGTPDVGDETILKAVDSEAPPDRLNVLFRDHAAWDTMIVTGGTRGSHRLREPSA